MKEEEKFTWERVIEEARKRPNDEVAKVFLGVYADLATLRKQIDGLIAEKVKDYEDMQFKLEQIATILYLSEDAVEDLMELIPAPLAYTGSDNDG